MGVVGSLPSPTSSSLRSSVPAVEMQILKEEPTPMNDECTYKIVNMNQIDFHQNHSETSKEEENHSSLKREDSNTVAYGPITVTVRKTQPPTLATGRRSKFLQLEGEEAIKRELRRKRNRDAAKKLKEKRFVIEQQLQKDIEDLESKEKELTSKVKNLETYKEELELRYRQILYVQEQLSKSSLSSKSNKQNGRQSYSNESSQPIKEEPRSSSPQWQLLFSI